MQIRPFDFIENCEPSQVIIDDGGHTNRQIMTSFEELWPSVRPGGFYFMEDLQVGGDPEYEDSKGAAIVSDVIQAWSEQLIIPGSQIPAAVRHPLPAGVAFIVCQREACVIAKQA